MEDPEYTDVEHQGMSTQRNNANKDIDEEDYKKMESYHEMVQVHRLTRKIYLQCLLLMVLIGILLLIFSVKAPYKDVAPIANNLMSIAGVVLIGILLLIFSVKAPYKDVAPIANNLMSIAGVSLFLVLSFFAFTCGSENAQTKLVLIILISIFLGLSSGFFVAMNVTIASQSPYVH